MEWYVWLAVYLIVAAGIMFYAVKTAETLTPEEEEFLNNTYEKENSKLHK